MRIALFGGSFDPPHQGHLLVADTLVAQNYVDQVWFIPCADHPFHKVLSPAQHRLAMLSLIPDVLIKTYELDKAGPSYSIETLEHFAKLHPEHTFSWVMGSDQVATFSDWHRFEEILAHFSVIVYPRQGSAPSPTFSKMVFLKEVPEIDLSSTMIRDLIRDGKNCEGLVPKQVLSYIQENKLYQKIS